MAAKPGAVGHDLIIGLFLGGGSIAAWHVLA